MSWRPEDWENPYGPPADDYADIVFEEGADAMLEALRKEGNSKGGREENEFRKGTWVFLSEEEK